MSTKTIQKQLGYEEHVVNPNFKYFKPHIDNSEKSIQHEISCGLKQNSKFINPKFFYDDAGSKLFEKICSLPEYYLTRVEINLLKKISKQLSFYLDRKYRLVELGSGSSVKTKLILEILLRTQNESEYFPIDVSDFLVESCSNLQRDFPNLDITGIIDTYESGLEFIKELDNKPNLVIFLGSSFGNFSPNDGITFLQKLNSNMKRKDLFLIGLDLVKEKTILENAYDDSQGITSQFNLNLLSRINEELNGNFDLSNFVHHSFYNEEKHRIEMYLRSTKKQSIRLKETQISFDLEENELIHTEHSYKYQISQIYDMMNKSDFKIEKIWQDEKHYFGLVLASKR